MALSIFFLIYDGLNLSIDFTGGSVMEINFVEEDPGREKLEEVLTSALGSSDFLVRHLEGNGYNVRSQLIGQEERSIILEELTFGGTLSVEENKFSEIGPVVSTELTRKAFIALFVTILAIIIFIAFAFRKVSKPISSWIYGLVAIFALAHDIIIPTGLFALLGVLVGAQIDILFIVALLAILGYSVNDTIVVFDRVRENLKTNEVNNVKEDFKTTVGKSLSQTYRRSINTSLTTILVLTALYFLGGEVTQDFSLVLIVGILAGTYSSIFLACPLLAWVQERRGKKA